MPMPSSSSAIARSCVPERPAVTRGLVIEPARAWHARRLTEIAFAAKRHWGYPEPWIRLWWDDLVISPAYLASTQALVARSGGRAVGWAATGPERGRWVLEHLWVDPSHMRRGVGSALLTGVGEIAARRGARCLVIDADPHAGAFYERHGAVRIGDVASTPRPRRIPVYELAVGPVPQG